MPKTTASVIERDVFATVKRPSPATNGFVKVREWRGKETVRSAYCEQHRKHTKEFVGENESGWGFRCPGYSKGQVKALKERGYNDSFFAGDWHYFVAEPPPSAL